jgi:hypothetical protein
MVMNLLSALINPQQAADERRAEIYKSLIHWEGKVGGQLFGPVSKGGRREFFCLDRHTWVWHEEWTDKTGRHTMTTRYDVRGNNIVKSQGNSNYQALSDEELDNFLNAVNLYYQRVVPELQRMVNASR